MDAKEYLKQLKRMCKTENCDTCPLKDEIYCKGSPSYKAFDESVIEIVEQWAKEHPVKTNMDKLKEVFPNIPFNVGKNSVCMIINCQGKICAECDYKDFWNQEYKDEENRSNQAEP